MTTASLTEGNAIDRVVLWATRLLSALSALLLFVLMVLTFVDVWGRYIFNAPVPGGFEVTELMMAALIFAGLPLVTAEGEHITVDLADFSMSRRLRGFRDALISLACAAMMGVLSHRMWLKAVEQVDYGDQTAVLHIPVAPVTFFMCATTAFTCVVLAALAWSQAFRSSKSN